MPTKGIEPGIEPKYTAFESAVRTALKVKLTIMLEKSLGDTLGDIVVGAATEQLSDEETKALLGTYTNGYFDILFEAQKELHQEVTRRIKGFRSDSFDDD
ncbi:MAG: hypothetical protein A3B17_00035 [Candidatus Yanofskybacteria bacterium RIFCSPLOWO2_01_FULL_45_72]|nr:MAG: hypothetical protein A3B17_00035 [Candidatus Yanofskybacteria bacterium RIFCSPLOWO2_01_FULL_45_72]